MSGWVKLIPIVSSHFFTFLEVTETLRRNVKKYLRSGGTLQFNDAFGTSIKYYIKKFFPKKNILICDFGVSSGQSTLELHNDLNNQKIKLT